MINFAATYVSNISRNRFIDLNYAGADISSAVRYAIDTLPDKTGTIEFSGNASDVFIDNFELFPNITFKGQGRGVTQITQKVGITEPLAKLTQAINLNGGGFQDLTLIGNAQGSRDGTADCIDISSALSAENFGCSNVEFRNFKVAYVSSQNERSTPFHNCIWRNCDTGMYINNNHPYLTGINEIESCDKGIDGNIIFDLACQTLKILYCRIAMRATQFVRSSQFENLIIFQCTEGAEFGFNVTVSNGLFVPSGSGSTEWLLKFSENNSCVNNATFRSSAGSRCKQADIITDGNAIRNIGICNNVFATKGVNILHNGGDISSCNISNNVKDGDDSFIQLNASAGFAYRNNICNNACRFTANPPSANTDFIVINAATSTGGNNVDGNTFRGEAGYANVRYSITGDARASNWTRNISRHTDGINLVNSNAQTSTTGSMLDGAFQP